MAPEKGVARDNSRLLPGREILRERKGGKKEGKSSNPKRNPSSKRKGSRPCITVAVDQSLETGKELLLKKRSVAGPLRTGGSSLSIRRGRTTRTFSMQGSERGGLPHRPQSKKASQPEFFPRSLAGKKEKELVERNLGNVFIGKKKDRRYREKDPTSSAERKAFSGPPSPFKDGRTNCLLSRVRGRGKKKGQPRKGGGRSSY